MNGDVASSDTDEFALDNDCAGRRVASVLDGALTPGEHRVALPRTDSRSRTLAAGVYYAELEVGGQRVRKSVVILD